MTRDAETACIASFAELAAVDVEGAKALLDESRVRADDFSGPHQAAIWSVVEAMVREGRAPDFFAVEPKCPGVPRALLTEALVSSSGGQPRERLLAVRDAAQRRRLVDSLRAVALLVRDRARPLAEAVAEAQKALEAVSSTEERAVTLDAEVLPLLDVLDEVQRGVRQPVLGTGLEALDATIGGLQPTLTVVGALPGVGKSALLAALVRNLSAAGRRVGFFSLEDERGWLVRRLVSDYAEVPLFVLANRQLGQRQMERVGAAAERAHAQLRTVVVDDRPAMTAADVVASARAMLTTHRVEALLVDHLGEIRLTRTDRHDLDIADALQQLRALAKTYRVPVVVACHLRRREGLLPESEPRLTDFAFSAAVERMARVALGLSRAKDAPNRLRVSVLKQTQGASGVAVELEVNSQAAIVANTSAPEVRRAAEQLYGGDE